MAVVVVGGIFLSWLSSLRLFSHRQLGVLLANLLLSW
jgi:hypothetical protein